MVSISLYHLEKISHVNKANIKEAPFEPTALIQYINILVQCTRCIGPLSFVALKVLYDILRCTFSRSSKGMKVIGKNISKHHT